MEPQPTRYRVELAKRRKRSLSAKARERRRTRAAKAVERRIFRWLRRAMEAELEDQISRLRGKGRLNLSKASTGKIDSEVAKIIAAFGVREADDSGEAMAARMGTDWKIPPTLVDEIIRQSKSKAKGLGRLSRRFAASFETC